MRMEELGRAIRGRATASVESSVDQALVDGRQSEAALRIQRGARRWLRCQGWATVVELPLRNGRRADIVALDARSRIVIVEVKSSIADFRADQKWPDYREHCDELLFAISSDTPVDIMPADAGLIVADQYGAHLLRPGPAHRLPPATRREMLLRFARSAADRLHVLADPGAAGFDT